jgi:hypothetical protein
MNICRSCPREITNNYDDVCIYCKKGSKSLRIACSRCTKINSKKALDINGGICSACLIESQSEINRDPRIIKSDVPMNDLSSCKSCHRPVQRKFLIKEMCERCNDYLCVEKQEPYIPHKIYTVNSNKFQSIKYERLHERICSICIEEFALNDDIILLPVCKHYFHKDCFTVCMENISNQVCPICRLTI